VQLLVALEEREMYPQVQVELLEVVVLDQVDK
jgi:hypothetical protein